MNDLVRDTDPDTSHDAAEKIAEKRTKDCKLAEGCFRDLVDDRGLTRTEFYRGVRNRHGFQHEKAESLRRRLSDLLKQGRLIIIGRRNGQQVLSLSPLT
jgi:uncharacterized protein YcaQ